MKDKEIIEMRNRIENWVGYNVKLHLLDISQLIDILKDYYDITEKEKGCGKGDLKEKEE
jgi:hypothetical protein